MSAAPAFAPSTAGRVARSAPGRTSPTFAPVIAPSERRRRRPRVVYGAVAVIGVFAILVTQLLLSITLSEGAYRISALKTQAAELDRDAQVLVGFGGRDLERWEGEQDGPHARAGNRQKTFPPSPPERHPGA